MSVEGIHWAQRAMGPTMCPFRKALMFALGERHNIDTGICMPDQEMLARDAAMSSRTVRKYAKILEDEGFIERRLSSRGNGVKTHYILHFDVLQARDVVAIRNDASERGAAQLSERPFGTGVPVPSGSCVPDHSEAAFRINRNTNLHESTRILSSDSKPKKPKTSKPAVEEPSEVLEDDTATLKAFEDLWNLWPRAGRERSRSRSQVLDQLRKSAKNRPILDIVAAARAFVAKQNPDFVPALDRWLKQGRFEHFMPKDLAERAAGSAPVSAASVPTAKDGTVVDWDAAVARYVRSGIWPDRFGDRPDEINYRGTLAPLEAIMATGKFRDLNIAIVRMNIDRLRPPRPA